MSYYKLFVISVDFFVVTDQYTTPLFEGTLNNCLWFLHRQRPELVLFEDKGITRRVLAGMLAISEVESKGRAVGAGDNGWVVLVEIDGKYYVNDQECTNIAEASVYFVENLTDELRMIP